jgi:hypothetical protein
MRVCDLPFVAGACVILSVGCGVGTTGLSGTLPGDGGPSEIFDATNQGRGDAGDDSGTSTFDANDHLESATADADDRATNEGDSANSPPDDANGTADASDAGTTGDASTAGDSGARDGGNGTAAPDAAADTGTACDDAGNCIAVPSGWTLVAFAATQASPCPTGFVQPTDLVEGPDTASACTCGACSVTTQPSCAGGAIAVSYDTITSATAGTCNLPGIVTPLGNNPAGTCLTDLYKGDYELDDLEYKPSGPSGGVCSTPGAKGPAANLTYAAQDRSCTAGSPLPSGCNGSICAPTLTAPYSACIEAPGNVACPSGPLSAKHVVGTDTTFDCSACGCSVTGHCTGTVTLYSDTKCKNAPLAVPADGTCNEVLALTSDPATSYNSYIYQGNAPTGVACDASGSSTAGNVTLTSEATICCAP